MIASEAGLSVTRQCALLGIERAIGIAITTGAARRHGGSGAATACGSNRSFADDFLALFASSGALTRVMLPGRSVDPRFAWLGWPADAGGATPTGQHSAHV